MNTQTDNASELTIRQTELPMDVIVCAWCKPKPGSSVSKAFSHGICPRHLRKMRLKLGGKSR